MLQEIGDRLDIATDYRWLIDEAAAPAIASNPSQARWLVDAVRKHRQVEHFRNRFPGQVIHVHLTADERVLQERYDARQRAGDDYVGNKPYDVAKQHPNEVAARSLQEIADQTIATGQLSPDHIVQALLSELGSGGLWAH